MFQQLGRFRRVTDDISLRMGSREHQPRALGVNQTSVEPSYPNPTGSRLKDRQSSVEERGRGTLSGAAGGRGKGVSVVDNESLSLTKV